EIEAISRNRLTSEDKFKNQDELAPILSGNDIKVIVKCSYVGEGKKIDIDKAAVEKTFNPLFHSVTAENGKYSLHIANGRELQNLNNIDDSYVGKVENVILENNIEWGKTVTYYSFWFNENIEKIQKKHPGKNSSVLLTEYEPMWNQFKPLEEKLFAADADKPVFDGNGKKIINLHIRPVIDDSADSENKRSGMFRTLYSEVKDLTFVDPVVMGTDDTGVLAGYAERAIVSGCGVSINSYNLRVIDAIDLSSVFYGATLVDPNVENKSVGLLLGCAENCSVSNSNIKIDYEMESSSEGIYVPVTSSNFGLIAGTADNCTVSGGTITAGINGGNTCGFTDRTKLSGAAGAAIGTVNGGTVSGITVDGTMSGITAGSLGGIVGSLKNAIIDSCEFNGTIDGGLSDSLGGLAGKVEAQKNANAVVSSSVGGKLKEISANCFGGAVGSAYGGKYIDISVSTDEMSVTSVWYIGETGDNKLEKDYGVYNCPTGLGYAGKFVGFISTGNFSNCSALCTSSGKRDDAHNYKNMQFVGAVKCTKTILSNKELYASSKPQGTSGIAAIMESENYYKATDGSNMYFSSAVDIDNYNYTDIDLTNCYYYNSAADKKKQAIETENKYYYYSKTVDGKTKTLADTMENQDYYLLAKPDGAGDYDIMVCKKKEIEGSTLKNDWKNDKYYIYASDATNNYYLFDSEDEEEKSDVSYYFDPKDTTRAYTVTGSFPSYDQNDGMAELSRYYSIDNVGRKLFRYYVDTIKCKRDLGINLDGALTEQEYNILLKHSWHWVQHGKTTEDDGQVYYTGNLIYDGYGDSNYGWSDAYLFLRVDDIAVGGILTPSQQVPVVLPYSDSLSRFFDSGTCRSTNSAFFLYARKVNGSMLIYREKKLSFGDRVATFDFGTDTTSVKWAKNNNYSAITTGVNIVATSGMVDAYSFSHKKTEETKHLV
ncbi:MAG: hypothetical protein MJ177_10440, partial [Clostridia bacterium]|nr:hypothetical protein [Clostridia bacterium]